jgi:adenylate kinase
MQKQLCLLVQVAGAGSLTMLELERRTSELQHGVKLTSLSPEAQVQLKTLFGMTAKAQDHAIQQHIRTSLAFNEMHERSHIVEKAHSQTFVWLVEDVDSIAMTPLKTDARTRYNEWLKSGTGIFHVIGKPGSGKSTLMKFLSGQPRTEAVRHICTSGLVKDLSLWGVEN